MFRQASSVLARSITSRPKAMVRAFSKVTLPVDSRFLSWNNTIANIEEQTTERVGYGWPLRTVPASLTCKLMLNVEVPYASKFKEVDMVEIPAITGCMHVSVEHDLQTGYVELKPGVLSVHEGNDTSRYFVSNGFAYIRSNFCVTVFAFEIVPIDQFDPSLVKKGLAEFTQKLSAAETKLEMDEARNGYDVYSALNSALAS